MQIVFNKADNGSQELEKITGNFYQNNAFDKIEIELNLATEEVIKLIGLPVYTLAQNYYYTPPSTEVLQIKNLLSHVQMAVAHKAAYNYYQLSIVSHEDNGRKLKVDKNNEVVPWEWMLDRDDQANLNKAYRMIDRLLAFLDESPITEWHNSDFKKQAKKLFVSNTGTFNEFFPIDDSGRFYATVTPFLTQIQQTTLKNAIGETKYLDISTKYQSNIISSEADKTLLRLLQEAQVLLCMVKAVQRLAVKVLPDGVVQQYKSMLPSRNASQAVLDSTFKLFVDKIEREANQALDTLKAFTKEPVIFNDTDLLPDNATENKIFRT